MRSVGILVGVSDGPLLSDGTAQLVEGDLDSVSSGVSSLWLSNSVVNPKEDSVELGAGRSEERRVGKGYRSRLTPDH